MNVVVPPVTARLVIPLALPTEATLSTVLSESVSFAVNQEFCRITATPPGPSRMRLSAFPTGATSAATLTVFVLIRLFKVPSLTVKLMVRLVVFGLAAVSS